MASIGNTVVTITPTLDLSVIVAQLRKLADLLESDERDAFSREWNLESGEESA